MTITNVPAGMPGLPLYSALDAPPADQIARWLPELVETHDAVVAALNGANAARQQLASAMPALRPQDRPGTEWAAAVRADRVAVGNGKKPVALAKLLDQQHGRYATAYAAAGHAAQLVNTWNVTAHTRVASESAKRLRDEEANLRDLVETSAVAALAAADEASPTDDQRRLDAAWTRLTELDQLLAAWRPVYAVLCWVGADRNGYNGAPVWPTVAPWPGLRPDAEPVEQAAALKDASLRAQLARQREPLRAR
jgi:hypothetical protein